MDIYSRLKMDHHKQRDLFKKILTTEGASTERKKLWANIKVELEAHALAEEQTFYAELMSHPAATEKARHSVAEHKEASDLVKELDEMDMAMGAWLLKCKHLKDRIIHHVDEEEREVFPKAKTVISDDRAEELAVEFNERKPAEKENQQEQLC